MPTYLESINRLLVEASARHPGLVQLGENIAQGSRICGLARNLPGRLITIGNCENTHVGVGLGMMLEGAHALLVVKQLDFLLLGADQMINTMNLVRASRERAGLGSFTILTIVCDQGYQGPQSSFNDLAGLCALARIDGYQLNGLADARRVFGRRLVEPGFRLMAVSQRQFPQECLELPMVHASEDDTEHQYAEGPDGTIVSLGFTLGAALELMASWHTGGRRASVFHINPAEPHVWPRVVASAARTRRLIVLDDTKGGVSLGHKVVSVAVRSAPDCHVSVHTRENHCDWTVNDDRFEVAA
jgi:pyruvate/2-oxoglutarate/acetoin dehydrogenase E1 component